MSNTNGTAKVEFVRKMLTAVVLVGALLVSQRRFVETPMDLAPNREFSPVIEGLEHIEPAFFDGRQWLDNWDFAQKKKLPRAVRISIACEDQNGRKCAYSAVAYVYCLNPGRQEKAK